MKRNRDITLHLYTVLYFNDTEVCKKIPLLLVNEQKITKQDDKSATHTV